MILFCVILLFRYLTHKRKSKVSSLGINTHPLGLLIYYVKEADFVLASAFVLCNLLTKHNSEQVSTLASQFETEVELRIFSPHVTYIAGVAVPEAVLTK